MAAQPRATRRPRPHVRVLGWLAAAALVALALLPGARVHEAYGSAGRSPTGAPRLTAEASPTPTPEGSPTPDAASTHTPDPSPTPTPVATPTPSPTPTHLTRGCCAKRRSSTTTATSTPRTISRWVRRWDFELTLTDGTVNEAHPITDSSGWAGLAGELRPRRRVGHPDRGGAGGLRPSRHRNTSRSETQATPIQACATGNSVTFEVDLPDGSIKCYFFNTPSQTPVEEVTASVNAHPVLDQDGDPATRWDSLAAHAE